MALVSTFAMAFLDQTSCEKLQHFFVREVGVPSRLMVRGLHATVYHARRDLGIQEREETLSIAIPGRELRMMVMVPGGENKRPNVHPANHSIGIRVRRAEGAADQLEGLRARFLPYESREALGLRVPSTRRTSAFGARHFQPHVTVLRPGAIREDSLTEIGDALRTSIDFLRFDRLVVRCRGIVGE